MKYLATAFSIILTCTWVFVHILGDLDYDSVSVFFPMLWLLVVSFKLDKTQSEKEELENNRDYNK